MNPTDAEFIGGSRGGCLCTSPQWDPFLSFSHMFSLKSACVVGRRPPTARRPPPPNGKSWIRHWNWPQKLGGRRNAGIALQSILNIILMKYLGSLSVMQFFKISILLIKYTTVTAAITHAQIMAGVANLPPDDSSCGVLSSISWLP